MAQLPWVHDFGAYRLTSFMLGTATLGMIAAALHRRFHDQWRDPTVTLLAVGAMALSPNLRGASYWGNTDALPLLLTAGAAWLLTEPAGGGWRPRVSAGRTLAIAVLAWAAFYTRQHFAFVPAYAGWLLLSRSVLPRPLLVAAFGAGGLPALWLFLQWKGLTPPGFARQSHVASLNILLVGTSILPWTMPFLAAALPRRRIRWAPVATAAGAGGAAGALLWTLGARLPNSGGAMLAKLAFYAVGPTKVALLAGPAAALAGLLVMRFIALGGLDHAVLALTAAVPLLMVVPMRERYVEPVVVCLVLLLAGPKAASGLVTRRAILILFAMELGLELFAWVWFPLLGHAQLPHRPWAGAG
jgi:hypothetical protein